MTPSPLNAEGFKGLGEGGAMPVLATIANAVEDALAPLGVRVRELPLTPQARARTDRSCPERRALSTE